MRTMVVSLLAASVAVSLGAYDASAKPRRHHIARQYVDEGTHELPLTVNRRSFLDSGPVAPVGTGNNYVTANTINNRTQDRIRNPDGFGNDVIQGQPYVPGRSVPVAEFATGPNIGDVYSGPILGYQPPQPRDW
jgi:hypothetical protein